MAKNSKIVMVAGRASHNRGAHEHVAGCSLLARLLNENMNGVEAVVHRGWPENPSAFENAAAIVVYSDGGGGHMLIPHLDQVAVLMERGVGLAVMHYAVEIPKGKPGDCLLQWIGGYFETHWSINPHWVAEFTSFPEHPVARGMKPFTLADEWYYHMRFREKMVGVTPLLSAVAPESTLQRPDGPHSGNPDVRRAVANKEPQHLAWCVEREDGGRGFGFTGGHFHNNWAIDELRKFMLNAIVWTAKVEVPEGGVFTPTPTQEELDAYLD
ncbi:ThuA domain-containing protein [Candidatus Poribacteria bacterium]|nr:ThuA domain-containing protein [Candidatus Poribacteria bacterium]